MKSSSLSYFNALTRCSEAAGGAAQRKLGEAGFHTGGQRLQEAGGLVR